MADGGRPTHKESRGLEEDLWRQFVEQLSKVVRFQASYRVRMVMPGHLVVETNGNQCGVRQEEEYDDERLEVGFSFIDREGAGNACSLYRGSSTPCSERLDQEGALMVKFKGTCAAIEQYELFKELKRLFGRTDGQVHLVVRWLGLTHECSDIEKGRVSGRTGRQTCVTVGRSSGRVVGYWSEGSRGGRADGTSIEQNSRGGRTHGPTANGRTYRRWKREAVRRTVLATDGRAVPRSTVGRADSRKDGRKNGRADGRSHGLGRDQSQGSGADRTPPVMGKSTERQEQTPTDGARGCKEALLRLANFGTEASHAQLGGGHFRLLRG